jgi:hypothetical protein
LDLSRRALVLLVAACLALPILAVPTALASSGSGSPGRASEHRVLPPLSFLPHDALTAALNEGRLSPARYALARVRSLFRPRAIAARYGRVVTPKKVEPTLLMRDLAVRLSSLGPRRRGSAEQTLARPDNGKNPFFSAGYGSVPTKVHCSHKVPLCFHWATKGRHEPPPRDAHPANGMPDWVDITIHQFERVWKGEVGRLGYRHPRSDAASTDHGPNSKTDIYLADIGNDGIYGYCTTDDPHASYLETKRYPFSDVSAYCVVDNDYKHSQFPYNSPLINLQVTAAHEFFHAIQFSYDFLEDAWLMEGTAVAMEDEIYDSANDNYQYLVASPLTRPQIPVDRSDNNFYSQGFLNRYGAFILWRFMTEYFATPAGRSPGVIRQVWRRADGSPRQAFGNQYSLQAAAATSRAHGVRFSKLFADFGVDNFLADSFYEEGTAYQHAARTQCREPFSGCATSEGGRPPFAKKFHLGASNTTTGRQSASIDHLSTNYSSFTPGQAVTDAALLRLKLNAPDASHGAAATLLVFDPTGVPTTYPFSPDANGNETMTVPFGTASRAVLVLSNGSTKTDCGRQKSHVSISCRGVPRDDDSPYIYTATLIDP